MPRTSIALLAALGLGCALPALAQDAASGPPDTGGERVNQLIVYGNDKCPEATSPNEITVCARKDEAERYRIPEPLRGIDNPANRAWTDRVLAYETVGKTGTMSCTPVGPGGYTGCASQLIHQAYAERKTGSDVQFGKLIAAERAKRLSTIDANARATQAQVEDEERDYDARHQGTVPAAAAASDTPSDQAPAHSPSGTTAGLPAGN